MQLFKSFNSNQTIEAQHRIRWAFFLLLNKNTFPFDNKYREVIVTNA